MFYCEKCRVKAEWPKSLRGHPDSYGTCEMCMKGGQDCYDVPSHALPIPKKAKSQHRQAVEATKKKREQSQ